MGIKRQLQRGCETLFLRRFKLPKECHWNIQDRVQFFPKYPRGWERATFFDESCGIACLQMALSYFNKIIPQNISLIKTAYRQGLLIRGRGMNLAKLNRFLKLHELRAQTYHWLSLKRIAKSLDQGHVVMASIQTQTQPFHLVVIVGMVIENHEIISLNYYDPLSSAPPYFQSCSTAQWLRASHQRGAVISSSSLTFSS